MMETSKFHSYTYSTEKNIINNATSNINSIDLTLMGLVTTGVTKKKSELLYMIRRDKKRCRIANSIQFGAQVLAHSRLLFYKQIYDLLRLLHPGRAQMTYCGR